jgi:hypothetical protein
MIINTISKLLSVAICFPIIVCPISCLLILPAVSIFVLPYVIWNNPFILSLLIFPILLNARTYGNIKNIKKLTIDFTNNFTNLQMSVFFDTSRINMERLYEIKKNELLEFCCNPVDSNNRPLIVFHESFPYRTKPYDKQFEKMIALIDEIIIIEKVNYKKNRKYLPIDKIFEFGFLTLFENKMYKSIEYFYALMIRYHTYYYNVKTPRFTKVDDIYNFTQLIFDKLNEKDIDPILITSCLKVFKNSVISFKCIDEITSIIIQKDHLDLFMIMYYDWLNISTDSDVEDVLQKSLSCGSHKILNFIRQNHNIIDVIDKNYRLCKDYFINACHDGKIDIAQILSDIHPSFVITSIQSISNESNDNTKVKIEYLIQKYDPLPKNSIAKKLGISVNTQLINIQHKENKCVICYDQYDCLMKCGHTFCIDCINDWYKTRKNNKICTVCTQSFEYSDIYLINS